MAVELVVGVLPDAARVEHDDVGRLEIVGRLHAVGDEQPGDPLRVVLVHLAPVGAHEEAAGHGGQCTRAGSTARRRIIAARRIDEVGPAIRARADLVHSPTTAVAI